MGGDASAMFEDDPTVIGSNPTRNASSGNPGAMVDVVDDDDEVDEDDLEDDDLLDEDDEEVDFDDDEVEVEEAGVGAALHAGGVEDDDGEADDDRGDDGREYAVDEDKLNAEEEDDLSGEESSLDLNEIRAMRNGLAAFIATHHIAAFFSQAELSAIL
jgi:hypothetical protein